MSNQIIVRSELVSANNIWEAVNNNTWANSYFPTKQKGKYLCQIIKRTSV